MGVLDGKTALVTGGSRGIGRAIVHRLASDGATVLFSFHENKAASDDVVAAVAASGGHAIAVQADQGDPEGLERLFNEVDKQLGELDIVVNNAAVNPPTAITDITPDDFDRVFAVNTKGPLFIIQYAGRKLRDGGRVINISTLNTALPAPGLALYSGSKAAIEQVITVAAREFGVRGITANTVSPGATDTDLLRATNSPEALEQAAAFAALGRLGKPADIANVVAFLAGPDSQWITGQNLRATGGFLL